jgi:hypothetical protein
MKILVDADSCPRRVREIIAKAAGNYRVTCEFVANRDVPVPESPWVERTTVTAEAGSADAYLRDTVSPGDLVVTRDIPLAAELVEAGAHVLNDRGTVYTRENVHERKSIRDAMLELRATGRVEQAGRNFGAREVKAFAAALDRTLRKHLS